MAATQLGPLAPLVARRLRRHRLPPAALGAPERHDAGPHLLLQLGLPGRRDRPLLHRPRADRLDLAGDPRRVGHGPGCVGRGGRRSSAGDPGRRAGAALRTIGLGGLALVLLAPTALSFSGAGTAWSTGPATGSPRTGPTRSCRPSSRTPSSSRGGRFSTPLWYATIVDGRRPDVSIIDDRTRLDCGYGELDQVIDLYLPTRPVYLIRNGDWELPTLDRPVPARARRRLDGRQPAPGPAAARWRGPARIGPGAGPLRGDPVTAVAPAPAPASGDADREPRACPGSRTSSRPTTRRRTSRGSSPRRSRPCRRSPTRSRSSSSTTARRTRPGGSPTT